MTQDEAKKAAAEAALKYVVPGEVLGVGTGSTVNYFIDALASDVADADKNRRVSVLEAFNAAKADVARVYQQRGVMLTERAPYGATRLAATLAHA